MVGAPSDQGKPPAKTEEWAGTPLVLKTIGVSLVDAAPEVRLAAVNAAQETGDGSLAHRGPPPARGRTRFENPPGDRQDAGGARRRERCPRWSPPERSGHSGGTL